MSWLPARNQPLTKPALRQARVRLRASFGQTAFLLLTAASIPVLLFAAWMGFRSTTQQRALALDHARITVERVGERVAAEMATQVLVAETMTLSPALRRGDFATFYQEAKALKETRPLWFTVELDALDGTQVLNLLKPYGAPLGLTADRASFDEALQSGQPIVGGIGPVGPVSGKQLVVIRVPYLDGGVPRFIITIALNPSAVSGIMKSAGLPKGWLGAIVDRHGTLIARSMADEATLGRAAGPSLQEAIAKSEMGFYEGKTLEGVPVEVVFRSLPESGHWSVHLAIPDEALNGPVRRALYAVAGGMALSLVLAWVITMTVSRNLAQQRREENAIADAALTASEERALLAVEAAELGTWSWDVQRDTVTASERCRALLDLPVKTTSLPSWSSGSFLEAIHPDDRNHVRDIARACLSSKRGFELELRAVARDGTVRWLRATGRASSAAPQINGIVADIGPQKRAEAEHRRLLLLLNNAQEDVQRRIARDLHDEVGQTVTGLSLGLKALERAIDAQPPVQKAFTSDWRKQLLWLSGMAGEIGRGIHRASADLRPPALDDLGLPGALSMLVTEWSERYCIVADIQLVGADGPRLPAEIETVVYRVVQEALNNVLKHAQAHRVSLVLERRIQDLRVFIEDNGTGFELEHSGLSADGRPRLGLSGMRERLGMVRGTLKVESSPGAGTTLFIVIELEPNYQSGTSDE